MTKRLQITSFMLLIIGSVHAHHAMEFIDLEGYTTPSAGMAILHLHHDYMIDDRENPGLDHWEYTPGFSLGITDQLMLDIHTHFARFGIDHFDQETAQAYGPTGPSPFMEAAAISMQYRLPETWKVQLAASVFYELPFKRSQDLLNGKPVVGGSFIANLPLRGHSNLLLNLLTEVEEGEQTFVWGLGYRQPLTSVEHGVSAGIELISELDGDTMVLPGLYMPLGMQGIILKTGLGFVPGQGVVRSNLSLMYSF